MPEMTTRAESATPRNDEDIQAGLGGTSSDQKIAIERAYQRFARPLTAFIRERIAPTLDSDEIATAVNETFCELAKYAATGKFRVSGALSTLVFRIARQNAIDLLRKRNCQKRRAPLDDEMPGEVRDAELGHLECADDEFAVRVNQRLVLAPKIRELWSNAANQAYANEIIRQFRLWIGTLPRLQRKVAELMLNHFGSATDAEMAAELNNIGIHTTKPSVNSARNQIIEKFKSLMKNEKETQ